jgi:ribA/ribD-fused uncharacterized protein
MEKNNKYTFFYKTRHPFSNWHPCSFEDKEGNQYSCSEQYMMAQKALLFGDKEIFEEIMDEPNPKFQKELGRKVKGFDSKIWNDNAKRIVYEGCKLKFEQNEKLLKVLLDTKGTFLVEASPYDRIWGIGLGEDDPAIHDPANWNGLNWLGEVLTDLRDDIINNQ